ncbi:TRAP transporter large permease subunit [bacterium]|nr:MAG: TRAP transporter large permease subunit [bacterium]
MSARQLVESRQTAGTRDVCFTVLDAAVDIVIGLALLGELLAVLANITGRTFFHASILWTDEVGGLVLMILAFIGGAIAYRRDQHSAVHTIVNALPPRWRTACRTSTDWLALIVACSTGDLALSLLHLHMGQTTPILGIPSTVLGAPLLAGMALIAVYALERLSRAPLATALSTGAVLVGTSVLVVATRDLWAGAFTGAIPITVALTAFLATVLIGFPVGFALVLSTLVYLLPSPATPLIAVPQNLSDGMSNFVLLALPFFILAGAVMEHGGISSRLVKFAHAVVGHIRGGLLQVTVVSLYLVSGLSGSKAADVAAVGPVMRNMLESEGVGLEEGAAVLAASAAMGETIPPSLGLLVLGSVTTLSMGALFTAGIVPAAVVALCLMGLIYVRAVRGGMPCSERALPREIARTGLQAVLPLLMPIMLYVGIRTGVATPTEVSALAVGYGIVLAGIGYRALGMRTFYRMMTKASTMSGMILFILAAASSFSWVLSAAQVPQALVTAIEHWHAGTAIFLIVSLVAMIAFGSLLEGLPAILILAPLLLPLAVHVGLNELHYAICLLVAIGIGAFLPPLGVGFYVACSVAGTAIGPTARSMLPYIAVLLAALLIVAFVPWFTLALPNAFAPGK